MSAAGRPYENSDAAARLFGNAQRLAVRLADSAAGYEIPHRGTVSHRRERFYVDDTKRDALYERYLCEVLAFARKVFPLSERWKIQ